MESIAPLHPRVLATSPTSTPSPPPPTAISPPPPSTTSPPPPSSSPPPPSTLPPPSPSPPPLASHPPPPSLSPPPPSISPPPLAANPPPPSPNPPPPSPSPPPPPSPSPPPPYAQLSPPPPPIIFQPSPPYFFIPPPPPPDSQKNVTTFPTSLVIGVSAGAVVAATALVILLVVCFYKKKQKKRPAAVQLGQRPRYGGDNKDNGNQYSIDFDFDKPTPWSPTSPHELDLLAQKPLPLPPKMFGMASSTSNGSLPFNNLSNNHSEAGSNISKSTTAFTYAQLLLATNGFSEQSLLGKGGFGDVYKGWIDGNEVAIKRLRLGSSQGEMEFRAEVEIISRVHHKNLVSLVGFCISEEERLLVYEFVPNNTLHFHLYEKPHSVLSWRQRWKIALGSAKGLAYLHEQCSEKIIHRDIKAANILLDYEYEPKVADFGLAKLQPADQTHVSTRIMGTIGYIAPEFINSNKLTNKADVFSYGVLLLELITGKPPILPSRQTLVDWARPLLAKAMDERNYEHLIDPKLQSRYELHEMERLIKCAATAVRYTTEKRPSMNEIVRHLEGDVMFERLDTIALPSLRPGSRNSRY